MYLICTIDIHHWPYRSIQVHARSYRTIQNHKESYRMIQVHTYPYKTTQDRTRPYKQYTTIHDLTGPYMILQDRTGSYKSTRCPAKHVPILFLNFSASYLSRNSILNIFQQPCLCKFQKYPISYYLVKPGARYCQNTKGR